MIQIIQRQKIYFMVTTVVGKECVKTQIHMLIVRQPNSVMGKIQNMMTFLDKIFIHDFSY